MIDCRDVEINIAKNLTEWCRENNKKLVLISTDYVYEGKENGYDESSETKPVNYYGDLKLEVEKICLSLPNTLVLRPTVIFGYDPNGINFLMQLLKNKEHRKIPNDQISNPTDVSLLVEYTDKLIEKDATGIFVSTGPETMDRYKFTMMICDVFSLDKSLFGSVSTSEFGQVALRPLNCGTNSNHIRKFLNYEVPTVLESLEKIKSKINSED